MNMNRPIKFRAWDGEAMSFAMDIGDLIAGHMDYEDDKTTVMQFTGLLDKNGKEIYEGDIMQVPKGSVVQIEFMTKHQHIPGFAAVAPDGDTERNIFHYAAYGEIIGNIYETPDLISKP